MSPLRDTVCFVNRVEGDLDVSQELNVFHFGERLRSHIQHLCFSGKDIFLHLFNLLLIEGRVQEMGYAVFLAITAHGVDLILHECDEWRYDDGSTLHQQRGKLITE